MEIKSLSERQGECLAFVIQYINARGFAPTLREIMVHMSLRSTQAVVGHVNALVKKRYLIKHDAVNRGIVPVRDEHGNPVSVMVVPVPVAKI